MAPSLVLVASAILAIAGDAVAKKFSLAETYDRNNFFDKFAFNTTGTVTTQPDDNWSWVNYLNKTDALDQGLASIKDNGDIYLGVDHTTNLTASDKGRGSLRLVSQKRYKHGLLVTRFTHLPKRVCGGWPAYWTLGVGQWPNAGEIDMYEGWNLNVFNNPAMHVGPEAEFGSCTVHETDQTASVTTSNCDNAYTDGESQWPGQGCQSEESRNGIWGSEEGGIMALEWTSEYIKMYTWPYGQEPKHIGEEEQDTSSWGKPSVHLKQSNCDIDRAFAEQQILFTLPFCGNPAGSDQFWSDIDGGGGETCKNVTGEDSCVGFVAKNPAAFEGFYFQIKDIRYFSIEKTSSTNSTSTTFTSTTSKSTLATTTISSSNLTPNLTSTHMHTTGSQSSLAPEAPTATCIGGRDCQTVKDEHLPATESKTSFTTEYTTRTYTITSCPPSVTDCPHGKVTTEVIPWYTTVCSVTAPSTGPSGTEAMARTTTITPKSPQPSGQGCPGPNCPVKPVESCSGAACYLGSRNATHVPPFTVPTNPVIAGASSLAVGAAGLFAMVALQVFTL